MAIKTKANKRSLVSLKRKEPSKKEKVFNDYLENILNHDINLEELIPAEEASPEELAKFPSIDTIIKDMTSQLNGDIEHDLDVVENIIGNYKDYPQPMHLQMTLLRELANHIAPDQIDELVDYLSGKNSTDMELDIDLDEKIFESLSLVDQRRRTKAIKHLEACIRRIESKHTPREHKGHKVYSFSNLVQELLAFPDAATDDSTPKYYQAPANYALTYQLYAGLKEESGEYTEAFAALTQSLLWNPFDADTRLQMANIFISRDETMQALELLEGTYPYIITESQLMSFYMLHSMILLSEDSDENAPFAFRLQRLSQLLLKPEVAAGLNALIDQPSDIKDAPISRQAFLDELKAHNIPFGAAPSALVALQNAIHKYGDNDQEIREKTEATYQKLTTSFDQFVEI